MIADDEMIWKKCFGWSVLKQKTTDWFLLIVIGIIYIYSNPLVHDFLIVSTKRNDSIMIENGIMFGKKFFGWPVLK